MRWAGDYREVRNSECNFHQSSVHIVRWHTGDIGGEVSPVCHRNIGLTIHFTLTVGLPWNFLSSFVQRIIEHVTLVALRDCVTMLSPARGQHASFDASQSRRAERQVGNPTSVVDIRRGRAERGRERRREGGRALKPIAMPAGRKPLEFKHHWTLWDLTHCCRVTSDHPSGPNSCQVFFRATFVLTIHCWHWCWHIVFLFTDFSSLHHRTGLIENVLVFVSRLGDGPPWTSGQCRSSAEVAECWRHVPGGREGARPMSCVS